MRGPCSSCRVFSGQALKKMNLGKHNRRGRQEKSLIFNHEAKGKDMQKATIILMLGLSGSVFAADLSPDQEKIEEIISSKCLACHSGVKPKGRLALDRFDVILRRKKVIIKDITSGKMPRGNSSWGESDEGKLLVELLSKK